MIFWTLAGYIFGFILFLFSLFMLFAVTVSVFRVIKKNISKQQKGEIECYVTTLQNTKKATATMPRERLLQNVTETQQVLQNALKEFSEFEPEIHVVSENGGEKNEKTSYYLFKEWRNIIVSRCK